MNGEGGGGGGDPADLFNMLFGGGRGGGGGHGPRKGEDTSHPLRVTLEDCYKGKTMRVAVNRTILSEDPAGGLMDRSGKRYSKKQEREVLDVSLDRGARHGQHLRFAGKGDVQPGLLPGDIVLVVECTEHPTFKRDGCDLIMAKDITLYEAICGTSFLVKHVGGHKVLVKSKCVEGRSRPLCL